MTWSVKRSGGRPLGRRMMKVGWKPECRWPGCRVVDGICPKAPR